MIVGKKNTGLNKQQKQSQFHNFLRKYPPFDRKRRQPERYRSGGILKMYGGSEKMHLANLVKDF
jgi:hypothetical protein